jgi:histone deacetylase 11
MAPAALIDVGVLNAFRAASGGTILAGREAVKHGVAINLGGGYHHAKPDAGEGFNVFTDMAIAIRRLQSEGLIRRAAIVDLDVHQGNGSAVIFAGDDSVFTFSMHEGDIYPVPKEKSDMDVELPAGTDDEAYLAALAKHLPAVLARSAPDIVFFQAGCDTLAGDPLARLAMTQEGIVRRDAMVIDACVEAGIPVVMVLGGGYSDDAWLAQLASIKRTIAKYSLAGRAAHPPRAATKAERIYTK